MKHICAWTILLSGVILGGCTTARPSGRSDVPTHQVTHTVYGMDCPGCHGGVEKNLEKIDGVVEASANWSKKTVTITLTDDSQVAPAEIEKAVTDSNFSLGEPVK